MITRLVLKHRGDDTIQVQEALTSFSTQSSLHLNELRMNTKVLLLKKFYLPHIFLDLVIIFIFCLNYLYRQRELVSLILETHRTKIPCLVQNGRSNHYTLHQIDPLFCS